MSATTPDDAAVTIDRALAQLRDAFLPRFRAAATEQALRDENAKILGKKGELTAILKQLGQAPPDKRKAVGEKVNALKQDVEAGFDACLRELKRRQRQADLDAAPFDLTLPGRVPVPRGHAHPISIVRDEVVTLFGRLGF